MNRWDTALTSYEERLTQAPNDVELSLGQMRCLEALGEWYEFHYFFQFCFLCCVANFEYIRYYSLFLRTQLSCVANQRWKLFSETDRERMSRMAAAAAWGLGQWDAMERYVGYIPRDTTDGAFYRAVLAVHRDQFAGANEVSNGLKFSFQIALMAFCPFL